MISFCYLISIEIKILDLLYYGLVYLHGGRISQLCFFAKSLRQIDFMLLVIIIVIQISFTILDSTFVLFCALDTNFSGESKTVKRQIKFGERRYFHFLKRVSKSDFNAILRQKGWPANLHSDEIAPNEKDTKKYFWNITKIRLEDSVFLTCPPP